MGKGLEMVGVGGRAVARMRMRMKPTWERRSNTLGPISVAEIRKPFSGVCVVGEG